MAQAGQEVGFVARGATLETLRSTGLSLTDPAGQRSVVEVASAENFSELRRTLGGLDVIIVATKALPGNETFPNVEGVPVVTTHNSVEIPYLAAQRFGRDNVIAGVVRGYLTHTGPAAVTLHPGPLSLNVGPFPGESGASAEVAEQLVEHLHAAGIGGRCLDDIIQDVWSKALFVTTTGELGALANQPLGYLRTELREQLRALMSEVETVARANEVNLPADIVDTTLGFVDQQIPEATSSMQRDIAAGLPNELDAQVGAIRRMGQRAGVETPLHDLVHRALAGRLAAMAARA